MDRTPKDSRVRFRTGRPHGFPRPAQRRPDAEFFYAADDLGFPYGPKSEAEVSGLVLSAMERLIAAHAPDCVVIACNTASTLALPQLRGRASTSLRRHGAGDQTGGGADAIRYHRVLATPGTVARDYTRDLIDSSRRIAM